MWISSVIPDNFLMFSQVEYLIDRRSFIILIVLLLRCHYIFLKNGPSEISSKLEVIMVLMQSTVLDFFIAVCWYKYITHIHLIPIKIKYFLCIRIYWFWKIYYFWKYFFEPQAIITEMNGILKSKLQNKVICLWKKKELTVILKILVYGYKRIRFHKKQEKNLFLNLFIFLAM